MDMRSGASDRESEAPMTTTTRGDVANYHDWVNRRRAFRRDLDDIGNLSKWLYNKPTVTELEKLVLERERKTERIPSLKVSRFSLTPPETRKEGIPVVPERLGDLVSSLSGTGGDSVIEKNLAEDIKAWSQPCPPESARERGPGAGLGLWPGEGDGQGRARRTEGQGAETSASEVLLPAGNLLSSSPLLSSPLTSLLIPPLSAPPPLLPLLLLSPVVWGRETWGRGPMRGRAGRCGARLLSLPSPELRLRTPLSLEEWKEQARIQQRRRARRKEGLQDEEVLAAMATVCRGDPAKDAHCQPSSLGGDAGRAVERFRKRCLGEYLDSLERCHARGVALNQAALQRVLLHPGDRVPSGAKCRVLRQAGTRPHPGCGAARHDDTEEEEDGLEEEAVTHKVREERPVFPSRRSVRRRPKMVTLSTGRAEVRHKTECWLTREEYDHMTRNMGEPSWHRANPNAFWPGRDHHVRLYLPQVGIPPEGVLFQRVVRSPAPSPGNWPVNHSGYSTSGDVDGHKAYSL